MTKFEKYFILPLFNLEIKMNNWVDDVREFIKSKLL